jgi:hypothetical protein
MRAQARANGYELLNSAVALGTSTDTQLDLLCALRDSPKDLSELVLVFDTLKKFLDLMSKPMAREFFKLMRALTVKGATIILLAHTNKNKGLDGRPIFEGVGDVRNDVDELIYFAATSPDIHREITVTATPDKVRCVMPQAISFKANVDTREVQALDKPIDVTAIRDRERQEEEDAPVLVLFKEALKQAKAGINSTTLVDTVSRQTSAMSSRQVLACFERHVTSDPDNRKALMLATRGLHNAKVITLNPNVPMNRWWGAVSAKHKTAEAVEAAEHNGDEPEENEE